MEAIIDRFANHGAARGMQYTLVSDDLNAVKNILERGPSSKRKYDKDFQKWRNSRNDAVLDAVLDADLIQKAVELYKECMEIVERCDGLQEYLNSFTSR